jgi:hypothetical protein
MWFILASGPSMCRADAEAVRGHGRVIAINNTVQLAPFADVLYSCDPSWWLAYTALHENFAGKKIGLNHPLQPEGVERLDYANEPGLGKTLVHTGNNSGYQAINYAYLQGAKTIVLLGYDMSAGHWHAPHPTPLGNFAIADLCRPQFTQLAHELRVAGVRVVNCSRSTTLKCFERMPLEALLTESGLAGSNAPARGFFFAPR